jgi:hypothetical protein
VGGSRAGQGRNVLFHSGERYDMKPEILLVDDNPREAELALLAFREHG